MGELLAAPIPRETEATCDDCAMCAKDGAPRGDAYFFRPDVKCCSYIPDLPNFLVGRSLTDKDPGLAAGRKTVEARIRAGVGVTPLGLGQSPAYRLLYEQGAPRAFGQSQMLRCPHFLDDGVGRCAIWRHRNSVCTTWFCKHVRGAVGARFWRSLNQLLGAVEVALARWCVLEIGLGGEALQRLFLPPDTRDQGGHVDADALDGVANAARSRAVWGAWWGRERDLYRESARLVDGLAWERVIAISGPEVRIFARTTQEAYRALASSELPERLVAGSFNATPIGPRETRVAAYSGYDPLALPKALMDLLPYFDGRRTRETLGNIRRRTGIRLDEDLVRKLADFEILVPPPTPPTP